MKKKRKIILQLTALTLLTIAGALTIVFLTTVYNAENTCSNVETVKKLTPITLGKETPMKFIFKDNTLRCIILDKKYIVAIGNDNNLVVVNPDLWNLFRFYCEQNIATSYRSLSATYTMVITLLVAIAVVLVIIASRE